MESANHVSNRNAGHRRFYGTGRYHDVKLSNASPQAKKLYNLMDRDGYVTRLTAAHYNIPNITARVSELRRIGIDVDCSVTKDAEGHEYGRWTIVKAS
jgi:hypothetical protein